MLAPMMLLLMLGWSIPAPAFFCLLPGKSHQHRPSYAPPPYLPPLRPAAYPRIAPIPQTSDRAAEGQEIEPANLISGKTAPEVIDGYRFRPLRNRSQSRAATKGVVFTDK